MTALIKDTNLKSRMEGVRSSMPMADNVKIYKGSIVCADTSGYANIGADTASFVCMGIADAQVDNTIGGHTAGGLNMEVVSGRVFTMSGTGFTQASVGQAAYVVDSGTVGVSSTNYVFVGIIIAYNSSTSVDVYIPPVTAGGVGVSGLTATAGELNVLHSVSAGTARASSGLVLGASKDVDTLLIDTAFLLGVAASVTYGATMALVVATPIITVAGVSGTSATATINCAATAPAGRTLTIVTSADASGTVTATFGTHFKTTGTQATTASHVSTISFIGDGTNWNETGRATAM